MQLKYPFSISSRLLPALVIGDGVLQLQYSKRPGDDGRCRYKWTLDIPAGEFSDDELQSGCGGGSLQEGFSSLLSFLDAAQESYRYRGLLWENITEDDNASSFPREVVEWAYQNSDEIGMLSCELSESETALISE